jgi:hypothetical protein
VDSLWFSFDIGVVFLWHTYAEVFRQTDGQRARTDRSHLGQGAALECSLRTAKT